MDAGIHFNSALLTYLSVAAESPFSHFGMSVVKSCNRLSVHPWHITLKFGDTFSADVTTLLYRNNGSNFEIITNYPHQTYPRFSFFSFTSRCNSQRAASSQPSASSHEMHTWITSVSSNARRSRAP